MRRWGEMTDLDDRVDALVAGAVVPVLKPRGYRKKRLTWVHESSSALREIVLQRSHGNTATTLRVYVEGAVYVPEFDRAIGRSVPDVLTAATPQYRERFEGIVGWPAQWIDLETWSDDQLIPRFRDAMVTLADHLEGIETAEALARVKRDAGAGLDLDLFAWWCAIGDEQSRDAQLAQATARFGHEDRWPILRRRFVEVADRYGATLPE